MSPKTRRDFEPEEPPWLIDDWFPLGHRGMDTAPEGSFKTMFGCWLAVCIASGTPVFGRPVKQGNVMIIDEETPESSLRFHLERFATGLGLKLKDLPIHIECMKGFRFGRKTELDKLLHDILMINPTFIRMDSMLAMLPSGRQAIDENSSSLGETIRDDLNNILSPKCSVLLAAHAKKYIAEIPLNQLRGMQMQSIVRGHGSIVGEACDTGYIIKKISEYPDPTRFCVVTIVRRQAIPEKRDRYIEMKEKRYGSGWARLEEIPLDALPPSSLAKEIFPIFDQPGPKGRMNHSSQWLSRTFAFLDRYQCKMGVQELLERKAIIQTTPQNYIKNPNYMTDCSIEYLEGLTK